MSLFALDEEEALEAAERFGTPCFVYRLDTAIASFDALRSMLPERAILAYAVKANPGAPLIKAFASRGAWFDCASSGELERVAAAQVPGGRILFAGPGKTGPELALAVSMGARIQVDGIEDLERLEALLAASPQSAASGGPLRLSLRVHPVSGVSESSRIIGGSGPSVFGVDEEELLPFLAETRRFERIRITGLQVFAASNERDAERLLGNYRRTFEIALMLSREVGALELIDLGGGLGITFDESESELDIMALGSGLVRILADNPWFEGHVIVEPGRFLAGPLCTSLDRLGDVQIPEPQAGDLVMLGQAGAYGFTESMNAFLSHPQAAEIWLEESLHTAGSAGSSQGARGIV